MTFEIPEHNEPTNDLTQLRQTLIDGAIKLAAGGYPNDLLAALEVFEVLSSYSLAERING